MEQKRYHIVIFSIVFAVMAWVSINMSDEHTIVRHMPVVLENLRQGRALRYPVPKSMEIWFRGNGWQLAALYLSPEIQYFIDLSSVGMENFSITRKDLFEHIKLPIALQPIDVKPETLILALDEYGEKRVGIAAHIVPEYHEGYGQVGSMTMTPESIMIGGSRTLLDNIAVWPTVYRRLEDLRAPVSEEIPLEEPASYSIQLFTRAVRMRISVEQFAEKVFPGIPIGMTGAPANREVILIPPKVDLIVRGGIDRLAKLTDSDFKASIDYQLLVQDSPEYVVPVITSPPEVKVVTRKPDRFQFIIRKRL